jgi:hypothetical protein
MMVRPVHHRLRSDNAVIEPGDVLMSNATGNCWRIEDAREVARRTPDPVYRHTWDLTVTRIPPAEVPALHLDLTSRDWRRWHAEPPWADEPVPVHPFERGR